MATDCPRFDARWWAVLVALAVVAAPARADAAAGIALQKRVKAAFDARQRIADFEMTLEVKSRNVLATPSSELDQVYRIWKSGDTLRVDDTRVRGTGSNPEPPGTRYVDCRNCERKGKTSHVMVIGDKPRPNHMTFFANDPKNAGLEVIYAPWTLLGLHSNRLHEAAVTRPGCPLAVPDAAPNPAVVAEKGDTPARTRYVLETRTGGKNGTFDQRTTVVFDADAGDSITRMEHVERDVALNAVNYKRTTDVTYRLVKPAGVWFPERIEVRVENAEGVWQTQEITVSGVTINQAVDQKHFTFADFGLVNDTVLELPEITNALDWPTWQDGKIDYRATVRQKFSQVVPAEEVLAGTYKNTPPPPTRPVPVSPPSFWSQSWPYLVGAVVLAAVAFVLLRKRR